jgi:hypothetical protein
MTTGPSESLLDRHTADWNEDTRTVYCSCGDPADYVDHIAALLGTDEDGARAALLTTHDNVGVNTGMCGGCETCGDSSAAVHCPVCGDADFPCLTWFVAAGHGPDTEGSR